MGEVVGAGLLAHVPTIVLPEDVRRSLNHGKDTTGRRAAATPPRSLRHPRLRHGRRARLALGHHRRIRRHRPAPAGGSVHLRGAAPRNVQRPYDFPGDPELARLIASQADEHGTWITAIDDDHLPIFYATTNLWEFLGQGLPDKKWITIGVCQTADTEDNLRLGRALGDAIAESDRSAAHRIWRAEPHLLAAAPAARPRSRRPEAHLHPGGLPGRSAAPRVVRQRRPRPGAETMPEFYRFKPEARFGHYLMMIGALAKATAPPPHASTASTRTRSAPGRCTCGLTGPPAASPAPDAPIWRLTAEQPSLHDAGVQDHDRVPTHPSRRQRRGGHPRGALMAGDGRAVAIADAATCHRWCPARSSRYT